jgi:5-methylcytosine-specific restriction endonuclease McrA
MAKRNSKSRREKNSEILSSCKKELAGFCGISGSYSALELVVVASAKLNKTVRGDIHPHSQIRHLCKIIKQKNKKPVNKCRTMKDFYSSRTWKIPRYQAFEKYGNRCQCCGATPNDGVALHVDHIKPRSVNPELAMDLNNLQILCEDCNIGKINQFDTDWRYLSD